MILGFGHAEIVLQDPFGGGGGVKSYMKIWDMVLCERFEDK